MSDEIEPHPDVEWADAPRGARRQCKWPGCGKLEGITGCPDHGIT